MVRWEDGEMVGEGVGNGEWGVVGRKMVRRWVVGGWGWGSGWKRVGEGGGGGVA